MPADRPARLLPSQCAVCHDWGAERVCVRCLSRFAPATPRCRRCALAVPAGNERCGACLAEPPVQDLAIAAVDYAYPWDGLVSGVKFHAALDLVPLMAGQLAAAVEHAAVTLPDCLLPAPLAPRRLRERGYNQAWLLAQAVARRLRLRADAGLLTTLRETPQQIGLPRAERAANVRGAYGVAPGHNDTLRGRRVALVDDVLTTGATAAELTHVLREAGAAEVQLWVFARTPDPSGS